MKGLIDELIKQRGEFQKLMDDSIMDDSIIPGDNSMLLRLAYREGSRDAYQYMLDWIKSKEEEDNK